MRNFMLAYAFMGSSDNSTFDENSWILDSGSFTHMTNNHNFLYDTEEISRSITVGNKEILNVTLTGKMDVKVKHNDDKIIYFTLTSVSYVETSMCNLISMTKIIKRGFTVEIMTKGDFVIKDGSLKVDFNEKYETENGYLVVPRLTTIFNDKCMITYNDLHTKNGTLWKRIHHQDISRLES